MKISRLHHLTQDSDKISHLEQIKLANRGGSTFVQLRIKNKSKKEILETAYQARELTTSLGMTLIINDHVDIAKLVNADGVHLGLDDLPISEARRILGADKIIGGTANSFENIDYQIKQGASYLGVGPYKFTTTKQDLKPLLGPEGIKSTTEYLKRNHPNFPVVIIGGVKPSDITEILCHGFYGVAVSSAINLSEDPINATKTIIDLLSN